MIFSRRANGRALGPFNARELSCVTSRQDHPGGAPGVSPGPAKTSPCTRAAPLKAMPYVITHDEVTATVDVGHRGGFDLQAALARACQLLSEGVSGVAIQDETGRTISGEDLLACCRGEKTLAPDLTAI